jgi:hypothetical protein
MKLNPMKLNPMMAPSSAPHLRCRCKIRPNNHKLAFPANDLDPIPSEIALKPDSITI